MVQIEDYPSIRPAGDGARVERRDLRYLEEAVTYAGGIVLRYGLFYGAANDGLIEPVRKRQYPIIGHGGGFASFIHLDDAAAATVLALEHGDGPASSTSSTTSPPGARVAAGLRQALGAGAALFLVARPAARRRGRVVMGTEARGASNAKGKRAWLGATLSQLARGLRGGLQVDVHGGSTLASSFPG